MEKNFVNLVLGGLYNTRRGNVVHIKEKNPRYPDLSNYEYISACDELYTKLGWFDSTGSSHSYDLVEFVGMHTEQKTQTTKLIVIQLEDGYTMIVESISDIPKQTKFKLVENFNV